MRHYIAAYEAANSAGDGFAPGPPSVADAVAELVADGWEVLAAAANTDEVDVLSRDDDELVVIGGDAHGGQPWAVRIARLEV